MNAQIVIAKRPRTKLTLKAPSSDSPVDDEPLSVIVPSVPELFPLGMLLRAAENVRHIRPDEDVEPFAAEIAEHGLLTNLIGYFRYAGDVVDKVMIVGGGRRLQALERLWSDGRINGDWQVPVLIRSVDEAIELSLAENLQQRTMSPVDEFFAFKLLMDRGDTSAAELAKRFGWTERLVKQRLRLAELAKPVLDALADREITLDVAMAYASAQDRALQEEVFRDESRRGRDAQKVERIRYSLAVKGYRTDDPLFRFVGAEIYERDGGTYDDDLFNEARLTDRPLATPFVLETAARRMVEFQAERDMRALQQREDLSPSIVGFLVPPDLRIRHHSNADRVSAPAGFAKVEIWDWRKPWRTIRNNRIDVHVLVGVDDEGKLTIDPRVMFVPKAQRRAIENERPASPGSSETEAQRQLRIRRQQVERQARRAAVGTFAGTFLEGRVFWPEPHEDRSRAFDDNGNPGWLVSAFIFVTDAAIADERLAAEAAYDAQLAAAEAAKP